MHTKIDQFAIGFYSSILLRPGLDTFNFYQNHARKAEVI